MESEHSQTESQHEVSIQDPPTNDRMEDMRESAQDIPRSPDMLPKTIHRIVILDYVLFLLYLILATSMIVAASLTVDDNPNFFVYVLGPNGLNEYQQFNGFVAPIVVLVLGTIQHLVSALTVNKHYASCTDYSQQLKTGRMYFEYMDRFFSKPLLFCSLATMTSHVVMAQLALYWEIISLVVLTNYASSLFVGTHSRILELLIPFLAQLFDSIAWTVVLVAGIQSWSASTAGFLAVLIVCYFLELVTIAFNILQYVLSRKYRAAIVVGFKVLFFFQALAVALGLIYGHVPALWQKL